VAVAYARPLWPRELPHDPRALCRLGRSCEEALDEGIPSFRRHWLAVPSRERLEPAQTARCARALLRHVVRRWGRPDLIHAHSTMWAGFAAYSIRKHFGIPYVVTEPRGRFSLPDAMALDLLPAWYRPYLRKAVGGARTVALVGSHLATQLEPLARPGTKFAAIPYGVDTEFLSMAKSSAGDAFRFVFVGSLAHQKGVLTLLDAFHQVHLAHPETHLTMVGEGPEAAALSAIVSERCLSKSVEFLGHVTRVGLRDALQRSQVCVLPSEFEGLPVSLCEAMSVGIPVIASRGSPAELFPEYAGTWVPFGDARALADAMSHMVRHRGAYDHRRIRAFAVSQYGYDAIGQRILAMYRTAIRNES